MSLNDVRIKEFIKIQYDSLAVGSRIKANCPPVGPGPVGGVPSVGVFLKILACIYANIGENHG